MLRTAENLPLKKLSIMLYCSMNKNGIKPESLSSNRARVQFLCSSIRPPGLFALLDHTRAQPRFSINHRIDKGMSSLEIRGGTPQNREPNAGGVVITRAEADFLAVTLSALSDDPFTAPDSRQVEIARDAAGLTADQGRFVASWIRHKGDLLSISELDLVEPDQFVRYLTRPSVFRILTEASRLHPDLPAPIPTKEELAVAWGLISRSPTAPMGFQKEARQELSKLMGYYSHDDGAKLGVQVIVKGDLTND